MQGMLSKKYKAKEAERRWQEYWQEKGIYHFAPDSKQPVYSIDTPPPTVNGRIHIGHIFSYSQAEFMARFHRMKGENVFYPFGFDDNGLPTERLVEQAYGIKAHQTTREHFTDLCLQETEKLEKQFRELFISAGFSCDWNYSYSTISRKSRITSQKSFLELYRKKKVYFSKAPALWCTECRTAIAQAELETKEIPSIFNYIRFYLDGSDTEYVEIATTRPELLAACQCIFIHPQDAKNHHLLGKKIRVPLFDFTVPVLEDEKVDPGKGSGVVMCCTFGDLTDLEWYKTHGLSYKEAILPDGTMSELCGSYAGMESTEARKAILQDLKEKGFLIRQEEILHNVAVHERCSTPMEITIKKQWFIDILSDRQKFLDAGNQIHWYPPHMKARYDNWVENLEWDWCISRQRYFGVPFPVWYCRACGAVMVPEESELPVNPLTDRPSRSCSCGCSEWVPEQDIMDTWATSSVTPLINLDWYDADQFREKLLPMSVRPNAHDIIRTWDFYTIVKSLYHTGRIPWKDVMISGHVMASKGEKISKKKANSKMEPSELIEQMSADAVRLWAASGSLGNDIVFSEEEFKNANKLINKLWNAAKFVILQLEGFDKTDDQGNTVTLQPFDRQQPVRLLFMDRWAIASYNKMLGRFEKYLENYEVGLAIGELEKYFWSYCDDYIEIIKNRVYKPELYGENARRSGLHAAYYTLFGILQCFAIYIPHITEEIYQGYYAADHEETSIHQTVIAPIDQTEEFGGREMALGDAAIQIISGLRRYKSEHNLSLKAQIEQVTVVLPEEINPEVTADICATCSCRNMTVTLGTELKIFVND